MLKDRVKDSEVTLKIIKECANELKEEVNAKGEQIKRLRDRNVHKVTSNFESDEGIIEIE